MRNKNHLKMRKNDRKTSKKAWNWEVGKVDSSMRNRNEGPLVQVLHSEEKKERIEKEGKVNE